MKEMKSHREHPDEIVATSHRAGADHRDYIKR